mmetsp:Transcript_106395/g.243569  ORF Transcript_106395/g.243569 Transcript_106395/m.243569 type:complete len:379 (+) Transcript_106395:29-1165(+)
MVALAVRRVGRALPSPRRALNEAARTYASIGKPRWGVAGVGMISNDFSLALKYNGSEIVACAARDAARAAKFADDFGMERSYDSYEALAQDPQIDVVYVGTIHTQHHRIASMLLEAGKHVLCEKPLGMNEREVAELTALAQQQGVFFMEGMWTRCFPVARKCQALLQSGELGSPKAVHADFGFVAPDDPSHRLWDVKSGGGGLLDIGCYVVGWATFAFGRAVPEVKAVGALSSSGADIRGALALGYPEGYASVGYTLEAPTPEVTTILCSKGYIIVDGPAHAPIRARVVAEKSRGEAETTVLEEALPVYPTGAGFCSGRTPIFPHSEGFVYEVQEVEKCLAEGLLESPVFTHQDSLAIVRITDRARLQLGVSYDADGH